MGTEIQKERNRMTLERILFHLDEATRFCKHLDPSELTTAELSELKSKLKDYNDAMHRSIRTVHELKVILGRPHIFYSLYYLSASLSPEPGWMVRFEQSIHSLGNLSSI